MSIGHPSLHRVLGGLWAVFGTIVFLDTFTTGLPLSVGCVVFALVIAGSEPRFRHYVFSLAIAATVAALLLLSIPSAQPGRLTWFGMGFMTDPVHALAEMAAIALAICLYSGALAALIARRRSGGPSDLAGGLASHDIRRR